MKNLLNHTDSFEKLEDLPNREGNHLGGDKWGRRKGHAYPYHRVQRFFESQVGQNWDVVFSKFVHLDWIPDEEKTREHASQMIELTTFMKDGKVWFVDKGCRGGEKPIEECSSFHTECLYVHPITKKLCLQKKRKQPDRKKERTFLILGNYHQLVKINGVWKEIKGKPVKSEVIEVDGLHYRPGISLLDARNCKNINGQWYIPCFKDNRNVIGPRDIMVEDFNRKLNKYGFYYDKPNFDSVKITLHRQLSSKELKKYGLKNDVKPIIGTPCKVCGNVNCQQIHNSRCPNCGQKHCRIHEESAYYTRPCNFPTKK